MERSFWLNTRRCRAEISESYVGGTNDIELEDENVGPDTTKVHYETQ
jgi:hypothetical protein